MQLPEALQIVQNKFQSEVQGQTEGEAADKYAEAFDQFPVVMEVAAAFFADQIIQQNYEARKQAMAQQGQGGNGGTPPIQA